MFALAYVILPFSATPPADAGPVTRSGLGSHRSRRLRALRGSLGGRRSLPPLNRETRPHAASVLAAYGSRRSPFDASAFR
jgi:hypothetical protein